MRLGSASTLGRPEGRSIRMPCRPPPPTNVSLARSTRSTTSAGSGATESVPASMRPASNKSPIRPRMWSACWAMMRWNSCISAWSSVSDSSSSVTAEPLMEVSGWRNSWLTRARNSVRNRSVSSSGARSCIVTNTVVALPLPGIGVTLMRVRTLRPSGTESFDLLGAHRLRAVELLCQRELRERYLSAVSTPAGDYIEELFRWVAGHSQTLHDPPRFPVERDRLAAVPVEDDDPPPVRSRRALQDPHARVARGGAPGRLRSPRPPVRRRARVFPRRCP